MRCPSISELPASPDGQSGWPWTSESQHWWLEEQALGWPQITIITPSYNTAPYLEATIRSVLLQGYPNLKYIVIDGGSTDGSQEIIRRYSMWLKYWVSESDQGQYDAIAKGFSIESGEIMGWLNSDDMLAQDGLSVVGSIMKQFNQKVQWLTGQPFYWDKKGQRILPLEYVPLTRTLIGLGGHDGRAIQWIMQEGTFWTRWLWETAGANIRTDLRYAGDFELWYRFAKYARLYLAESLIGGNRRRPGQKTQISDHYNLEIDRILMQAGSRSWVKRIISRQPLRSLIRIYLRYFIRSHRIRFDPDDLVWRLV